jgi:hypothetical protein
MRRSHAPVPPQNGNGWSATRPLDDRQVLGRAVSDRTRTLPAMPKLCHANLMLASAGSRARCTAGPAPPAVGLDLVVLHPDAVGNAWLAPANHYDGKTIAA